VLTEFFLLSISALSRLQMASALLTSCELDRGVPDVEDTLLVVLAPVVTVPVDPVLPEFALLDPVLLDPLPHPAIESAATITTSAGSRVGFIGSTSLLSLLSIIGSQSLPLPRRR
jgi:hypothetical protein